MAGKQAPRHRGDLKPITPITEITGTFAVLGRRGAVIASATGVALTGAVASTAASAAPTVLPTAPSADFVSKLGVEETTTLVSLDVDWDGEDTVGATAQAAPLPDPEPEPEPEPVQEASRDFYREASVVETPPPAVMGSVVATAEQFLGVPYVYGGSSPAGFDCSGLVQYVYAMHGISLPRTAASMLGVGVGVSAADAQPGDIVVMNGGSHVGIYVGGGQIIHSPQPGQSVSYAPLSWFGVDGFRRV